MDSRKYLALSLCFLFLFPDLSHSNIQLPGWLGDNKMQGSVLKLKKGVSSATFDPSRVTQLSWRPRAFLYKGFLSDEECDHLINLARDKLEKSMVADNESGKSIMSEVRTSSGMFLRKYQEISCLNSLVIRTYFNPQKPAAACCCYLDRGTGNPKTKLHSH